MVGIGSHDKALPQQRGKVIAIEPKFGSWILPTCRYLNTETQRHRDLDRYGDKSDVFIFTHLVKWMFKK